MLRYLPIWLCGAPRHVAADRRTFSRRDSMNFRKQELDMVQEQNKETRKETTYKNKKRLRKRLIKRLCKRLVNSYKLLHLSPPPHVLAVYHYTYFVLRCILDPIGIDPCLPRRCREPAPRLCPTTRHYSTNSHGPPTTSHETSHDPRYVTRPRAHVCFFTSRPVAVTQTFIYTDTLKSSSA